MVTALAHRLLGIRVQPVALCRPRTDDGLPQQVGEAGVGHRREALQLRQRRSPFAGNLGKDADACPHVLATLGVVGGAGVLRGRPQLLPQPHQAVEVVGADKEEVGVAAHLVQRGQPRPAVEGAILHGLGHHHAGGLLEALCRAGRAVGQHGVEQVEHGAEVGTVLPREPERTVQVFMPLRKVGAVHLEIGKQLCDGGDHLLEVGLVGGFDAGQHLARDPANLGVEDRVGHCELALVHELRPHHLASPQLVLQLGQPGLAGGVDQHPVDQGERVVAGGACRSPDRRQLFENHALRIVASDREDLLHQHVAAAGERGQVVEVLAGVPQAVGMIDAQAVHEALVEPALDLRVRLGEPLRVLNPQRHKGVHGEEPPIVQAAVRLAPADQLVVLPGVDGVGILVGAPGGVRRQREALVVVVQFATEDGEVVDASVGQQVVVTDDGDAQLSPARGPVDVERAGVR